jgi:transcriptional regulator with XRE-family HTH domain
MKSFTINGGRLRQARLRRRWPQKFVAATVGVSEGAISQFEGGKCIPSSEMLYKLCGLYGLSADSVLNLEPSEPTYRRATADELCKILSSRSSIWNLFREYGYKSIKIKAGVEVEVWVEE